METNMTDEQLNAAVILWLQKNAPKMMRNEKLIMEALTMFQIGVDEKEDSVPKAFIIAVVHLISSQADPQFIAKLRAKKEASNGFSKN